jgi:hypothetical protein
MHTRNDLRQPVSRVNMSFCARGEMTTHIFIYDELDDLNLCIFFSWGAAH